MKNILIAPCFLFFITCISHKHNNQKEYSVILKRHPKDTISITYKLDSFYKEVNAGLEHWEKEDAKKYEKKHEVILEFNYYTDTASDADAFVKIGPKKRARLYNDGANPFSIVEEYPTIYNNQKGYFTKSKRAYENGFILSYCTINMSCKTLIIVSMIGKDLGSEDEGVFKALIESFTFQKN